MGWLYGLQRAVDVYRFGIRREEAKMMEMEIKLNEFMFDGSNKISNDMKKDVEAFKKEKDKEMKRTKEEVLSNYKSTPSTSTASASTSKHTTLKRPDPECIDISDDDERASINLWTTRTFEVKQMQAQLQLIEDALQAVREETHVKEKYCKEAAKVCAQLDIPVSPVKKLLPIKWKDYGLEDKEEDDDDVTVLD